MKDQKDDEFEYICDSDNQKNQERESSYMKRDWERQISNYVHITRDHSQQAWIFSWIFSTKS